MVGAGLPVPRRRHDAVAVGRGADLGKVAVGGLIDRLEKSGLLRREADATDRRVNRVFLEPKSKLRVNRRFTCVWREWKLELPASSR